MRKLVWVSLCGALCACSGKQGPPPEDPPFVKPGRVRTAQQTLGTFTLEFNGNVMNPTSKEITITGVRYDLTHEDEILNEGMLALSVTVPAGGEALVQLPIAVEYARDLEELEEFLTVEKLPVLLDAVLTTHGDDIVWGQKGFVRGPRMPTVVLGNTNAARQRHDAIAVTFFLEIHNENPFEVKIGKFSYILTLEGVEIADGIVGAKQTAPPGSNLIFEVPVGLTEENIPGLGKIVKEKNALSYKLTGKLEVGELRRDVDIDAQINFTAERD